MITQLKETDLALVLEYRLRMMTDAGGAAHLAGDWRELTREYYERGYHNATCAHFGWVEDGRIVGTAGALIRSDFPHFTLKYRCYGWIMDVYVLPEYRRRGIARQLTQRTLDWLREKHVKVALLSASDEARRLGLYESLGFQMGNMMRVRLDGPAEPPAGGEAQLVKACH